MTEIKVKYTEKEILEIFKEQHRLCSPLDPEAESWAKITKEMSISEWRWANDLLEWEKLSQFLNQEFRTEISKKDWYNVLEPAKDKTLKDVCGLISLHAQKDTYEPKMIFGQPCLKASVFLTIKKNLKEKGVDISELRPSSTLSEYMGENFSPILEEITLTGTKSIEAIQTRRKKSGFWNAINIFDPDRYEILMGEVKTFRDLTEKIVEEKIKKGHNRVDG